MSIVGSAPRGGPPSPHNFSERVYRYGDRLRVKSGLTGWAQVHGLRAARPSLADRVEWGQLLHRELESVVGLRDHAAHDPRPYFRRSDG